MNITTPPWEDRMRAAVTRLFEDHGCHVTHEPGVVTVEFPEGTSKEYDFSGWKTSSQAMIFAARVGRTTKYKLTLPDGWQVGEMHGELTQSSNFFFYHGELSIASKERTLSPK